MILNHIVSKNNSNVIMFQSNFLFRSSLHSNADIFPTTLVHKVSKAPSVCNLENYQEKLQKW